MTTNAANNSLTLGKVFLFWLPLAGTWGMMSLEQPLCSGLTARLARPELNLAAFGVALAILFVVESPVWMFLSAATVLVDSRQSYLKLRNFALGISISQTLLFIVICFPPVFRFISDRVFGLPPEISKLAHTAAIILALSPFAVGVRRFYQGVLIGAHRTKLVAVGTMLRLGSMITVGLPIFYFSGLEGSAVAGCVLTIGVFVEAAASRLFCGPVIKNLMAEKGGREVTMGYIAHFYLPLLLTGVVVSASGPVFTFFLARMPKPIESLAVYPVINGFLFLFVASALAFQEVVIANAGLQREGIPVLKVFAVRLALILAAVSGVVIFTPLVWYCLIKILGLASELAGFAVLPLRIGALLPLLFLWNTWQRGNLLHARISAPVSWASAIEVVSAGLLCWAASIYLSVPGAIVVFSALVFGRFLAGIYLRARCRAMVLGFDQTRRLMPAPGGVLEEL